MVYTFVPCLSAGGSPGAISLPQRQRPAATGSLPYSRVYRSTVGTTLVATRMHLCAAAPAPPHTSLLHRPVRYHTPSLTPIQWLIVSMDHCARLCRYQHLPTNHVRGAAGRHCTPPYHTPPCNRVCTRHLAPPPLHLNHVVPIEPIIPCVLSQSNAPLSREPRSRHHARPLHLGRTCPKLPAAITTSRGPRSRRAMHNAHPHPSPAPQATSERTCR